MKINVIGSKVQYQGVKFSGRFNKMFVQSFRVENISMMQGWKTHSLCTHMFAIASHKIGVFW